jgi:hypothetical protein
MTPEHINMLEAKARGGNLTPEDEAAMFAALREQRTQIYDLQATTIDVAEFGGKAAVQLSKRIAELEAEVAALRADKERLETARPYSEWHDDIVAVLWHMIPIQCPPYVGDPMCCDWPFKTERNLFWTPLPDCNAIQERFNAARKGER